MSQPIDWEELVTAVYARVLLYTAKRLRGLSWRGRPNGPILKGMTPKDFVHDAIIKTMSGQREWNRDVSLFRHLAGVISGDISHLVNSLENKRSRLHDDEKIVDIADHREGPEMGAIRKSQLKRYFAYLEKKRPVLGKLAEAVLYRPSGITEELVRELGLTAEPGFDALSTPR
jgi:hypothetical protein